MFEKLSSLYDKYKFCSKDQKSLLLFFYKNFQNLIILIL